MLEKLSAEKALQNRKSTRDFCRYPPRDNDLRSQNGLIFPAIKPQFRFSPGQKIFTVGSCFARNIEDHLPDFDIPTRHFSVPKSEWERRPNGLLNEYNPASTAQRLIWAAKGIDTREFIHSAVGSHDKCLDLLLPNGSGVAPNRLMERRNQIDVIYKQLRESDLMILTLGLVECWYDKKYDFWLNRAPPPNIVATQPGRFELIRLDATQTTEMLTEAFKATLGSGTKKILLTVSPVPFGLTFSGTDCVIANSYSKAVLRHSAEELKQRFSGVVDYFPSYEIVTSGGVTSYIKDQIHVRDDIVQRVVGYMLDHYLQDA